MKRRGMTPPPRTLGKSSAGAGQGVAYLPDDPVAWIEREFFIPETNAAIHLEPYQADVVRRALSKDVDGNFNYSLVLWSDLKKSAKSTIAGAVVLWLAWHHQWESCRVVGNDLKQANSRTFYYITRAIALNPRLQLACKVKNYHIELIEQHTTIEAIAVDPKGEAGGGDLIVCFTELWAAKNEAAKALWTETTLSPLKYGQSLRWCESYAGFEGESPILEQLYEQGVKHGNRLDEDLELYENKLGRTLCLWNTRPRCEWQTQDYYAQEEAVLSAEEFDRIHGNIWASATQKFIPIEWWDACKGELPEVPRQPMVVALDAAVSNDCFGIVGCTWLGDIIQLRHARRWIPPKDGKLEYTGSADRNNTEYPEGYLRWLVKTCNVVAVVYDEFQLHDFCTRLSAEHLAAFEAFPQAGQREVADSDLRRIIMEQRIAHDGHVDMREHIGNADRKELGDRKLRIVKRQPEKKIDLAVCLSMAAYKVNEIAPYMWQPEAVARIASNEVDFGGLSPDLLRFLEASGVNITKKTGRPD